MKNKHPGFGFTLSCALISSNCYGGVAADDDEREVSKYGRLEVGDFGVAPKQPVRTDKSFRGDSLKERVMLYVLNNKFEQAFNLLEPITQAAPQNLDVKNLLGYSHRKYGDYLSAGGSKLEALREYDKALGYDPEDAEAKLAKQNLIGN